MTATELTITIKNEDAKYTKHFLLYEPYTLDPADPVIAKCLEEAKADVKGQEIDSIKFKVTMEL